MFGRHTNFFIPTPVSIADSLFSSCGCCPSVHPFIHVLQKLLAWYFENKQTYVVANWHNCSTGQGYEQSTLRVRRSRSWEVAVTFGGLVETLFSAAFGRVR